MKIFILVLTIFFVSFQNGSAQTDGDDVSIGKYKILYSDILKESRTLLIHLPNDYERSERHYPVLYMLYGNHTQTYYAEVVSVLESFGSKGIIPHMILVGITNTDRYRDLLPVKRDGSETGIDNFLSFFKTELIPFVDSNYRAKDFKALLGPQAGANFAMYTMFKEPELFNAFFVNNPFRWNGGRDLLISTAESFFNNTKSFNSYMFITHVNSDELEKEGNEYIKRFVQIVKDKKPVGFKLETNYLPDSKEFISPLGFKKGIRSYFKDYVFPVDYSVNSLKDIKDYYSKISEFYCYEIDIPGHVLTMQSDKLASEGKTDKCMEILNYMIEIKTQSANAYWRLADISYRSEDLESAKMYLEKMLEIIGSDSGIVKSRYDHIVKLINEKKKN